MQRAAPTLLLACAFLGRAQGAHAQAAPAVVPLVVTSRALDVRVDYNQGEIAGSERLVLVNGGKKPAATVPLLLNRLMRVATVSNEQGKTLRFKQEVVLFRDDSLLQVTAATVVLAKPVPPGDSATITVHFGGHLVGYTETGSLYIQDHVDTAFTIIREDAYAFPALGVPSRALNRAHGYPPFAFSARVTVPDGFVAATGGELLPSERRDSLVTWRYRSMLPSPTLNIAVARYHMIDRPGLRVFYFPADSAGAQMIDRAVAGAMAQFAGWFGSIGANAGLTVIEIPEGWGSQASLAGGIIQTADAFRDPAELPQLYHELSHLWNVEDRDQPSPRWNEGLAMFLQYRMAAQLDGWSNWDARLDRSQQIIQRMCQGGTPCASVPFADYGKRELTDLSYSVGFAMFDALYTATGASAFDSAYREFFQRYRTAGATGADLQAAFHRANPASDKIFAEWYLTTACYARLGGGESLRQIVNGYAK
jgi:hypothetical protein